MLVIGALGIITCGPKYVRRHGMFVIQKVRKNGLVGVIHLVTTILLIKVINGFSDLIVAVFGDKGRHARAAVGMASLPRGQAVEIELIVEVYD